MSRITDIVSPRRVGHLFLRELAVSYRGLLIAAATVAGAVIVVSAVSALAMSTQAPPHGLVQGDGYLGFYRLLLFLGGCIVTSLAFREVWQAGSGIAYLSLPGSTLEKLAVKLLVTSVGFAAGSLIFMSARRPRRVKRWTAWCSAWGTGSSTRSPPRPCRRPPVTSWCRRSSCWARSGSASSRSSRRCSWIIVAGVALAILGGIAMRVGVLPHLSAMAGGSGGGRVGGWMFQLNGPGFQNLFRRERGDTRGRWHSRSPRRRLPSRWPPPRGWRPGSAWARPRCRRGVPRPPAPSTCRSPTCCASASSRARGNRGNASPASGRRRRRAR